MIPWLNREEIVTNSLGGGNTHVHTHMHACAHGHTHACTHTPTFWTKAIEKSGICHPLDCMPGFKIV